jgi:hypothetical protein
MAPSTFPTIRRAIQRRTGAAARRGGRRTPSAEEELLYRELVYLTTERPAMRTTLRSTTRQARPLIPTMIRSLASPSLAKLFPEE